MHGRTLHLVFDNYEYEYSVPSKMRDSSQVERVINDLQQELPPLSEWGEFLKSSNNKCQIVNLIAEYLKLHNVIEKDLYVNQASRCFFKSQNGECIRFESLDSTHREADQKIPMHAVFAGQSSDEIICVAADDTDIYISLLYVSHLINAQVYFRQGKVKDKDGITYHDVHALALELGVDICNILPCFHALTGSDYTNPFFGRSKIQSFRKILKMKNSYKLLLSMLSEEPNIDEVTKFVLQIIYNRPLKEKSPGESRYNMLTAKKKSDKRYPSSKALPPDQSSLKMKILRGTFVAHIMSNCLNPQYVPLDPSNYAWVFEEDRWEPIWFEGKALPEPSDIVDDDEMQLDSGELDEYLSGDEDVDNEDSDDSENVESCNDSESDVEL